MRLIEDGGRVTNERFDMDRCLWTHHGTKRYS